MGITIKNLTKRFDTKTVFQNFSYSFPDKGIFSLVGESGIGKTTLLRMISGLDKDYSGEIIFDKENATSYAFQEHRLFPSLTALENVFFANFDKRNKADVVFCKNALLKLGFDEKDIDLYPAELSGGMRQRTSLARAFVNPSKVLLLDEPTKELDEINKARVLEEIAIQAKEKLVILVTHDHEDLKFLGAETISIGI